MTTNDVYWAAALGGLLPPTPDDSTKDSTQGFDRFAYPHDFQSPDKTLGQPHGQIPHNVHAFVVQFSQDECSTKLTAR